MNGTEHYTAAEEILADPYMDTQSAAIAQVHATLALAAATAMSNMSTGETRTAWARTTG